MYPLVVVLGVGWLRRDGKAWITALPFVVVGAPLSLYHWLVERVPSFAESSSCSAFAPCTAPYFEKLGFVTLAWMCLSSFLLIGTMLALFVTAQRARGARAGRGIRRYRGPRRRASRGAGEAMNQKAKVNQKRKGNQRAKREPGASSSGGEPNRSLRSGTEAGCQTRRQSHVADPRCGGAGARRRGRGRGVRVGKRRLRRKATAHETGAVTVDGTALPQYTGGGVDTAIGDTIPTLSGVSFDGSSVTIGPTGKPQVVMFVAHWCPHCQAEVPRVVELAKSGAFKGIDVVHGRDRRRTPPYPNYPPSAWLKRENWPFPVMVDSPQQTAARPTASPPTPTSCSPTRRARSSDARRVRSPPPTSRRSSPPSPPASRSPKVSGASASAS